MIQRWLLGHSALFPHPQQVTKGARTKLILSIRKLAKRPETLQEIEQVRNRANRASRLADILASSLGLPFFDICPYLFRVGGMLWGEGFLGVPNGCLHAQTALGIRLNVGGI